MGRSAYWNGREDSVASSALGDANRGAFLALQSAVSTRRGLVATDPPERRAISLPRGSCAFRGWVRRFVIPRKAALSADGTALRADRSRAEPVSSWEAGDCSLPCGAAMLRVAASHQFACR